MATDEDTRTGHPLTCAVRALRGQVGDLLERPLFTLGEADAGATLVELTALAAQVAALELQVAAHAETVGVGTESGAASAGVWWAVATNQDKGAAIGKTRLGQDLSDRWTRAGTALAAGEVTVDQARVIVNALNDLPAADLDAQVLLDAEIALVDLAADHSPRELRILGARILTVVAPEIGEEHDRKRLEAAEATAAMKRRLTLSRDGHGSVHGRFTIPEAQSAILEKALDALTAPKHVNATDGAGTWVKGRPSAEKQGEAFCELLETLPTEKLPQVAGMNASIVVLIDLETLTSGVGAAMLETGQPITAAQARRWACEAQIIPAVLGGKSQPMDLGLGKRLFDHYQRIALILRDKGCTAIGCDAPASRCHAHHDDPWSQGGRTDLANGRLLCSHHHARVHDPAYAATIGADNQVTFHRRR